MIESFECPSPSHKDVILDICKYKGYFYISMEHRTFEYIKEKVGRKEDNVVLHKSPKYEKYGDKHYHIIVFGLEKHDSLTYIDILEKMYFGIGGLSPTENYNFIHSITCQHVRNLQSTLYYNLLHRDIHGQKSKDRTEPKQEWDMYMYNPNRMETNIPFINNEMTAEIIYTCLASNPYIVEQMNDCIEVRYDNVAKWVEEGNTRELYAHKRELETYLSVHRALESVYCQKNKSKVYVDKESKQICSQPLQTKLVDYMGKETRK